MTEQTPTPTEPAGNPPVGNPIDPHHEWRMAVDKRLDDGAAKMKSISSDLAVNTEATKTNTEKIDSVKTDTAGLVTTFNSFQGAMNVLNMLGKLAKPLAYILMLGSAFLGLLHVIKGGGEPPR
jgi:hypothetical protein